MTEIVSEIEREDLIEIVGGKGRGLLRLKSLESKFGKHWLSWENSIVVPPFFIIPSDIDLVHSKDEILSRAKTIGNNYAVRSSSPLEDVGENSFDGIFDTYL